MEDFIGLVAFIGFWAVFFGLIALTIRAMLKWSQRAQVKKDERQADYVVARAEYENKLINDAIRRRYGNG